MSFMDGKHFYDMRITVEFWTIGKYHCTSFLYGPIFCLRVNVSRFLFILEVNRGFLLSLYDNNVNSFVKLLELLQLRFKKLE